MSSPSFSLPQCDRGEQADDRDLFPHTTETFSLFLLLSTDRRDQKRAAEPGAFFFFFFPRRRLKKMFRGEEVIFSPARKREDGETPSPRVSRRRQSRLSPLFFPEPISQR